MIPAHFNQFLWHFFGIQLKQWLKVMNMQNNVVAVADLTYYFSWIPKNEELAG